MKTNKYRISLLIAVCAILFAFTVADTAANNILLEYSWSPVNMIHPNRVMQWFNEPLCNLVNCQENKWYMGENLIDVGLPFINFTYTPNLGHIIKGVDLGISVRMWQGYTMMYMGDTAGNVSKINCEVNRPCNDAIMMITDLDGAHNGIDARILVDENAPNKYIPLIIPGVNQTGNSLPPEAFGKFNVPTGAGIGVLDLGPYRDPPLYKQLYLWYATAMATDKAHSYLACSDDGVEFHHCPLAGWYPIYPGEARDFSADKFIFVSPVLIEPDWWEQVDITDSCTLCKLKGSIENYPSVGYRYGFLLFGARGGATNQDGSDFRGYRESPIYLAYMELQSGKVWYFTGSKWSPNENDAKPIISEAGKPEDYQSLYWFGEYSVKLIPESRIEDMHLVMISNHNVKWQYGGRVTYRTASLLDPDKWSDPLLTCAVGYGPYIIDEYTEIKKGITNRLVIYHTVSSWNGNPHPRFHEPYGVFTTQLRLRQDPTDVNSPCGEPPVWPPQP